MIFAVWGAGSDDAGCRTDNAAAGTVDLQTGSHLSSLAVVSGLVLIFLLVIQALDWPYLQWPAWVALLAEAGCASWLVCRRTDEVPVVVDRLAVSDLTYLLLIAATVCVAALLLVRSECDYVVKLTIGTHAMQHGDQPIRLPVLFEPPINGAFAPLLLTRSRDFLVVGLAQLFGVQSVWINDVPLLGLTAGLSAWVAGLIYLRFWSRCWRWALLGWVLFLFTSLYTNESWGVFTLLRLQDGKGMLLALWVPLTFYFALQYFSEGRWSSWCWLMLVQVCCLGSTENGIYIAPMMMGLLSVACMSMGAIRRGLMGLASTVWPVLMGVVFFLATPVRMPVLAEPVFPAELLRMLALWGVQLPALILAFWLLMAWFASAGTLGRTWLARLMARFVLLLVLCVCNPVGFAILMKIGIPESSVWRLIWVLPTAILAGGVAGRALLWLNRQSRGLRGLGFGAIVLLLGLHLALVRHGLQTQIDGLAWPDIKAAPNVLQTVREIVKTIPATDRRCIDGHYEVMDLLIKMDDARRSAWVPGYFDNNLSRADYVLNRKVRRLLNGRANNYASAAELDQYLRSRPIDCLIIQRNNPHLSLIQTVAHEQAFELVPINSRFVALMK